MNNGIFEQSMTVEVLGRLSTRNLFHELAQLFVFDYFMFVYAALNQKLLSQQAAKQRAAAARNTRAETDALLRIFLPFEEANHTYIDNTFDMCF